MSSFSCSHYEAKIDGCLRLNAECVPGRPGCVLFKNSVFAIPWEERLEAKRHARTQPDGVMSEEPAPGRSR